MSLLPLVGKSGVVGLGPPLLVWSYSQQRDVCRAQAARLGHSGVVAAAARKARVQTARQEPTRPRRGLVIAQHAKAARLGCIVTGAVEAQKEAAQVACLEHTRPLRGQRVACRASCARLANFAAVAVATEEAHVQTAWQEPTRPRRTLVSNMMSVARCANPHLKLVSHTYKCKTADRHIKVQMALAFCISMPRTLNGICRQHLAQQQSMHLF